MYRLMRNTHLWLGLGFALVLAVYLASSVRLAHRSWFSAKPTVTSQTLAVDPDLAATPRALGLQLIREQGLRGEIARIREPNPGEFSFVIRRLGTNYQVRYTLGSSEASVQTNRLPFIGMLTSMHFAHGFWHGDASMNLWGTALLLTSVALLLIGATGIYLWFKTYDERAAGVVILACGLAFALSLMVLVRIQG